MGSILRVPPLVQSATPLAPLKAASEAVQLVVDAGALAACVAKADERHLILILEFRTAEDADRVARPSYRPFLLPPSETLLIGEFHS